MTKTDLFKTNYAKPFRETHHDLVYRVYLKHRTSILKFNFFRQKNGPRFSPVFLCFPWFSPVLLRFSPVFPGFHRFSPVLLRFSPVFPRFSPVFPGSIRFFPGFLRFSWVLPGVPQFCWVFPGSSAVGSSLVYFGFPEFSLVPVFCSFPQFFSGFSALWVRHMIPSLVGSVHDTQPCGLGT